jgi:hypothetical protein
MEIVQVGPTEKATIRSGFAEPSDGLEPSTPSLPSRVGSKGMQLKAAVRKCHAASAALAFAAAATCARSAPKVLHAQGLASR